MSLFTSWKKHPRLLTGSIYQTARAFTEENAEALYRFSSLALIAIIFFGLGVAYAGNFLLNKREISIQEPSQPTMRAENPLKQGTASVLSLGAQTQKPFLASRNGKYYYKLSCKTTIKEENKIYFTTEDDAKKAGYAPSTSCFR